MMLRPSYRGGRLPPYRRFVVCICRRNGLLLMAYCFWSHFDHFYLLDIFLVKLSHISVHIVQQVVFQRDEIEQWSNRGQLSASKMMRNDLWKTRWSLSEPQNGLYLVINGQWILFGRKRYPVVFFVTHSGTWWSLCDPLGGLYWMTKWLL